MPIITREDGVQFVIRAYRERIKADSSTQITQKVREIANQQGQFVHLYKQHACEYEAVFANNSGYLLAESIRHYFPCMDNLLFLETTHDDHQFLFVVIKQGKVFADSLLSAEELKQELMALSALNIRFQIMLSGRLPQTISDFKQGFFPESIIDTLEYIKEPLLPILPASKQVKLIPLALALRSKRFNRYSILTGGWIAALSIMMVISIGINVVYHSRRTANPSYPHYRHALASPEASRLLAELATVINGSYFAPDWRVTEISQSPDQYRIKMTSDNGTFSTLKQWSARKGYQLAIDDQGALLRTKTHVPDRAPVTTIDALDSVAAQLIDTLKLLFENPQIRINKVTQHHHAREAQISVAAEAITSEQLLSLSNKLSQMPLVLKKTHVRVTKVPLFNIQLQLSAWGS